MLEFGSISEKISECKNSVGDTCGVLSRAHSNLAGHWSDAVGNEAAHVLADIYKRWCNAANELQKSMEDALSDMKALVAEAKDLGSVTDQTIGNLHGLKVGY